MRHPACKRGGPSSSTASPLPPLPIGAPGSRPQGRPHRSCLGGGGGGSHGSGSHSSPQLRGSKEGLGGEGIIPSTSGGPRVGLPPRLGWARHAGGGPRAGQVGAADTGPRGQGRGGNARAGRHRGRPPTKGRQGATPRGAGASHRGCHASGHYTTRGHQCIAQGVHRATTHTHGGHLTSYLRQGGHTRTAGHPPPEKLVHLGLGTLHQGRPHRGRVRVAHVDGQGWWGGAHTSCLQGRECTG